MENIEELENNFLFVNNSVLEYIKKNFKDDNKLSSYVNNIKGLFNFIRVNNLDDLIVDIDYLIEKSSVLKKTIDNINNNKELKNVFVNNEEESISSFFKRFLSYSEKELDDISTTSNDIVHDYLKQIKFPLLSDEELRELYKKKNAGDEKAREKIIESNLRLVVSVAKRYMDRGFPFMDIIGYGNIGLIIAVDRFDINKGFKFSTYATYWIKQSIMRSIENYSRIVRLPSYLHNDVQNFKYVSNSFYYKNGRYPTEEELSKLMNKSLNEINRILKVKQGILYLDEPVGEDKDATFGDYIPDDIDLEDENISKEYYSEFMEDFNKSNLREKEKQVLLLRVGYYDDKSKTLEEIGDMYGVTRERIRQIQAESLRKLRHNKTIQKYNN